MMADTNCIHIPLQISNLTSLYLSGFKSWPTWCLIETSEMAHINLLPAVKGTFVIDNNRFVVPQCAINDYRKVLPIYTIKFNILNTITICKLILVHGIATVGKSSQVAQFILEEAAALNKSANVILLKPQTFGTRDLAEKIAMDRGENVGATVGYISTNERIYTSQTSLLVSTYEVFLKTFIGNTAYLDTITHLIIDDVDKKSVFHNLILYIIRNYYRCFPNLKVILLSDSDNNDDIIRYLDPLIIEVKAKQAKLAMWYSQNNPTSFPITTMRDRLDMCEFLVNEFNMFCFATLVIYTSDYNTMMELHRRLKRGPRSQFIDVIVLHESIPIEHRRRVLNIPLSNMQKVVIADKASIPIWDVKCIIDFGLKHEILYEFENEYLYPYYRWKSRKEAIRITDVESNRNALICVYRLYNEEEFENFSDLNNIHNQNIQKICFYAELIANRHTSIGNILQNLIDPVNPHYMYFGIKSLRTADAMDNFERLTQLGVYLMQLSVPPNLGKMLIHACILQCLDPIITLVSFINNGYLSRLDKLTHEESLYFNDEILSTHAMFLNLFEIYQDCICYNRQFGIRYGFSSEDMEIVLMTRIKLTKELKEIGIIQNKHHRNMAHVNMNATCWPLVQACFVIGHYPKILHYVREGSMVLDYNSQKSLTLEGPIRNYIRQSPISSCSIVYNLLNANLNRCNPTSYTVVPELTAYFFCPDINCATKTWMYTSTFKQLCDLKKSYEKMVRIRLAYPEICMPYTEHIILTSIMNILTLEYSVSQMKPPTFNFSCRMRFFHDINLF